jgi:hypothetical protein
LLAIWKDKSLNSCKYLDESFLKYKKDRNYNKKYFIYSVSIVFNIIGKSC